MPPYDHSAHRKMRICKHGIEMTVFLRDIDTFTYHDSLNYKQQQKYDRWSANPGNTVHKSMVDHVAFLKKHAHDVEEIGCEIDTSKNMLEKAVFAGPSSLLSIFHVLDETPHLGRRAKNELQQIIELILFNRLRDSKGLKSKPLNLNCIFLGNKNTGMTMVASIYGRLLKDFNLLRYGAIVEMDLGGLTVGHSWDVKIGNLRKMEGQIKRAFGNVLFIRSDSVNKVCSSFKSNETISVLMKKIEGVTGQPSHSFYKDINYKLVTIIAGNETSMSKCLDTNPVVKSVFPTYVHFDDFSTLEILNIFRKHCEEEDYKISPTALELIRRTIEFENKRKDGSFEVREYVESLLENIKKKQSRRLVESGHKPTRADLITILPDDV